MIYVQQGSEVGGVGICAGSLHFVAAPPRTRVPIISAHVSLARISHKTIRSPGNSEEQMASSVSTSLSATITYFQNSTKLIPKNFPGETVSKTPCSQRGPGFDPWSGNWIPPASTKSLHSTTEDPTQHSETADPTSWAETRSGAAKQVNV